jgi:hypothetical protein
MYELAARLKQVRDDGKEARSLKVLISDQGVHTACTDDPQTSRDQPTGMPAAVIAKYQRTS